MTKPRRYHSEKEICDAIDRLKGEIPALYEKAKAAGQEAERYLADIGDHVRAYDKGKDSNEDHPNAVYKKLKRAAKRAASKPISQEKKIKRLSEALAEFRTERMGFLTDESVEVK